VDAFDKYLVLTFVGETRVLAITDDDELDEAELSGFDADAQVGRPPALLQRPHSCACGIWDRIAADRAGVADWRRTAVWRRRTLRSVPGACGAQTLHCSNVAPDQILQVTRGSVRLVSAASQQLTQQWRPPAGSSINLAAASPTQVVSASTSSTS